MGQDRYGHQSHFCDRWVDRGDIFWTSAEITRELFQLPFMDLGVLVRGVSTAFIVFNNMVLRDVQVSPAFTQLLEVCTISINVLSIAVSSRSLHECRAHKSLEMPLSPSVEPKLRINILKRDNSRIFLVLATNPLIILSYYYIFTPLSPSQYKHPPLSTIHPPLHPSSLPHTLPLYPPLIPLLTSLLDSPSPLPSTHPSLPTHLPLSSSSHYQAYTDHP